MSSNTKGFQKPMSSSEVVALKPLEDAPPASSPRRQSWTNALDFLVSMIGSAVGLGNVWRFPFLCYRNGGGTFLIPYFLMLLLLAMPLQLLEVSLGQLTSRACIGAWDICPVVKGVGFFQLIFQLIGAGGYVVVIGWGLYYTILSFTNPLPWSHCNNEWNSPLCSNSSNESGVSSTTEFWEHRVLGLTSGMDEAGNFQWQLYLCCTAMWVLLFFCWYRGVSVSGKIMYPMTLVPYILLFTLLGFTATMSGSQSGLHFFLTPVWASLGSPQVWADAGRQVFYTLSVGGGTTVGLASHNLYRKKSYIDCLVTTVVNCVTSMLAGCVIFMTLGHMSVETGVAVSSVAESGVGLAFVTYPLALTTLPWSNLWSAVFFLMLVGLGLSSIIMTIEAVFSGLADLWPVLAVKHSRQRIWAALALCAAGTCTTGVYMLGNGMYLIQLVEFYNGSRTQLVGVALQCLALVYVFGGRRFAAAVNRMYNFRLGKALVGMWGVVCPLALSFLLVNSVIAYTSLSFRRGSTGEMYNYPGYWVAVGWMIEAVEISCIPGFALYLFLSSEGSWRQRLRSMIRPRLEEFQRQRLFLTTDAGL